MLIPTSRQDLIEWVFRKLGRPVINVNIADEQAEDRVDEALTMYREFHGDGITRDYLKHQITSQDKINQYLTIPSDIVSINRVFSVPSINNLSGLFNFKYQFYMNDFYRPGGISISGSLSHYDITMTYLSLFDFYFNQQKSIRFNRNTGKLFIDDDWNDFPVGGYLVAEVYMAIDTQTSTKIWSDLWLQQYIVALFKEQWAHNLRFVSDVPLVGGVKINAERLMKEAMDEKKKLEDDLRNKHQLPPRFFIG